MEIILTENDKLADRRHSTATRLTIWFPHEDTWTFLKKKNNFRFAYIY